MATAQQQIAESAGGRKGIGLGLAAVFLTYFAHGYFTQILMPALPKIAADLDGMPWYSWGISIPHLGQVSAMLMVGKLSDLYGRRALLLVSLAICLFGAVWSALSTTFMMQGIQGISATLTGKIITPGGILMGFLGVPAGFILARTKRYK
jgi:MFS family permease